MLESIIIGLLIATILNVLFKKLNLPTIIGYIITGTILGYALGLYSNKISHELKEVAEFGVVFLMFTIGLEFSIEHLKKMKKEVFVYGSLQVILTTAVITWICNSFFSMEIKSAVIVGTILTLSSTAVILKVFSETGETNTIYGKNIVGVLIFQDLAVIPILLMISIFTNDDQTIGTLLTQTFVSALILLGGMWFIGRRLLNPFFKYTLETNSQEIFLGAIFLIVLGASFLANYLNFSYSLGAFLAGMLIAETHYKHQVEADLIPFRELLLGVFFVTVGLQIDVNTIINNGIYIILILPVVMILKTIIISLITIKQKTLNIIKTSLALAGLGEFGLVIVELATNKQIVSEELGQILSATIILSLIITPIGLKKLHDVGNFILTKVFRKESKSKIKPIEEYEDHVVIIGYGRLGHHIASELKKNDVSYIIVEGNKNKFDIGKKENQPIILGNAAQQNILEVTNMKKAKCVFISVGNSRKLMNICNAVRLTNESIPMVVKVHSDEEKQTIKNEFTTNTHVVVETEETAKKLIEKADSMLKIV